MGLEMSPSFASVYMGFFEQELSFSPLQTPKPKYISHRRRYLDDVFFIWTGSETRLQEFHNFINSKNKRFQFTLSSDANQKNFLDILVIYQINSLKTYLY